MNINNLKIGDKVEYHLSDIFVGTIEFIDKEAQKVKLNITGRYKESSRSDFEPYSYKLPHVVPKRNLHKLFLVDDLRKFSKNLGGFGIGDRVRYVECDKYYYLGEVVEVAEERVSFTVEGRFSSETGELIQDAKIKKKHFVQEDTVDRLTLMEETLDTHLSDKQKAILKDLFVNLSVLTKDEKWFATLGDGEWEQELSEA